MNAGKTALMSTEWWLIGDGLRCPMGVTKEKDGWRRMDVEVQSLGERLDRETNI